MPGTDLAELLEIAPILAGQRHWGYLALAGGELKRPQVKSLVQTFAANLGVILENASLFEETQQKLNEAAMLSEVSQAISTKLAQDDLLPYLAESLVRILNGSTCLVFVRQLHSDDLSPVVDYRFDNDTHLSQMVTNELSSLAQAVMQEGQALVIEDVEDTPHLSHQVAQRLTVTSLLGLPLVVQRQSIGAVIIGKSREQPCFTASEVSRAMVVANQGGVAIANARLFREVEQRLVELGTLAEISRVILAPLPAPEIYQRVVNELARAFGYPFVAFYQVEDDGLELGAQSGYEDRHLPTYIPWGQGWIGKAADTGQTSYVPDTSVVSDQKTLSKGVVSQIALPLRKNGRILGVLSVESRDPLTEADLSLLQSLSYQVSTAVENARLYAAEQREREVARTLLQIAGDLSGTLQLEEVLSLILERLQVVVSYKSAAIGLLSGESCYVAATRGMLDSDGLWETGLLPEDFPLIDRVLRERKAIIVADTYESAEWVPLGGNQDVRSWLGVPLAVQERTVGLLMVNHDTAAFYDQDSARLALAFAQHAALAIENARLYERAQATLREQTLLREMTTTVSSTLDAGQVLRLLAERLVTVLGVTSTRIASMSDEMQTANLVAEHFSADADAAERSGSVGLVYELKDLPVTSGRLDNREPLLITLGEEPEEWREEMKRRAGQAMLLLPLIARDRVTGFVELWDSRSRRYFTQAEIALAQTLINPAAVAIDNARLFAETQRGISEMMLLYDIAVAAASTLEMDTVLQSVVKTLQFRVLEKAVVNVWLLDDAVGTLELRAHAGEFEGLHVEKTISLDNGLCGQVIRTGQPILIRDSYQDAADVDYGPEVRSILCVPLAWGQRVVGVLQVLSPQEGAFSNHDLRLLRTMAGSLAIAVENVRLFSELKRSEEALMLRNRALKSANDRLQELDRLKSSFVASVSHELRTPLNSIIGFSEVLMDGLAGDIEPMAQEYLGYIHDSGKHLLDLINDILDLSRIEAGRMKLVLEEIDVIPVIEEVRATLAPMIAKRKQQFSIDHKDPPLRVIADRLRLKQVLLNLVGNAVKFTQIGGRIVVATHMADPVTLRIDVVDNGPGISLEDQSLIFQEFRQARSTEPGQGTGLGLAITRRLIDLHGGRIWVESQLGAGATFTVLLPIDGPALDELDRIEGIPEREVE
jgi:GAF domain-containing protein